MKANESKAKSIISASRKTSSIKARATKSLLINPDYFTEPLVAIPPDGGWGWVIVAASGIVMFCLDGVGYCFAIFFEDISKELNCKVTDVALTSSILGGFYYLVGPLTCSAINRFGFQVISVTGGIIAALAFLLASYMNSLLPFIILIGICGGTAFNLAYTPSVIAIGFYFERWRALAMAFSCCGSSIGVMCVPIIMTRIFKDYHWRTKFKIISGVFGFCGLLGLTYRPIKTTKIERTVQFGDVSTVPSEATIETERELSGTGGIMGVFQRFKNALFPTISEVSLYSTRHSSRTPSRYNSKTSGLGYGYFLQRRETTETEAISNFMNVNDENFVDGRSTLGPVKEEEDDDEKPGCCGRCCQSNNTHRCLLSKCCKNDAQNISFTNINRPLYREDIFYTGSVYTLSQYPKERESHISGHTSQRIVPSLMYTLSVSRAPTQRDLMQQNQCVCCPEAVVRVLVTMLNFQMLKSPTFILLLVSGYLSLMSTYICYIYVGERALELGIERNLAMLLLSILGIANTIGRATCGVASCFPIDINLLSWTTLLVSGVITVASVFMSSSVGQIIFCCIFGFTIATFAVLRAVLFVELFGLENLTNCFGLNMIFQAAASFSGIPAANFLYNRTGTFAATFIFSGAAIVLSAILLIPIKTILKWEQKRTTKKTTINS